VATEAAANITFCEGGSGNLRADRGLQMRTLLLRRGAVFLLHLFPFAWEGPVTV
jgi:hypothetical protein